MFFFLRHILLPYLSIWLLQRGVSSLHYIRHPPLTVGTVVWGLILECLYFIGKGISESTAFLGRSVLFCFPFEIPACSLKFWDRYTSICLVCFASLHPSINDYVTRTWCMPRCHWFELLLQDCITFLLFWADFFVFHAFGSRQRLVTNFGINGHGMLWWASFSFNSGKVLSLQLVECNARSALRHLRTGE